ncbi:MAG: Abi family protein [Corynebacterium sp.]|nr:Abi family protein [Corynebacterium sp.]
MEHFIPPARVDEQVELLASQGLELDRDFATQCLQTVSFYRLSHYFNPAQIPDNGDTSARRFRADINFHDIIDLYESDRRLRTIIYDGLERIEIALRAVVVNILSTKGEFGHEDPRFFRTEDFCHQWNARADERIERAMRSDHILEESLAEYDSGYPISVISEALDFGDISRLVAWMRAEYQEAVSKALGLHIDARRLTGAEKEALRSGVYLRSWIHQLSMVRNIVAHHGRLWNRNLKPASTTLLRKNPRFGALPPEQSQKLYGMLLMTSHMLGHISPGTTWPERVAQLLKVEFLLNPVVHSAAMGLPRDWDGSLRLGA